MRLIHATPVSARPRSIAVELPSGTPGVVALTPDAWNVQLVGLLPANGSEALKLNDITVGV